VRRETSDRMIQGRASAFLEDLGVPAR